MKGFGWAFPKSWQNQWQYHLNWINAMNLMPLFNHWLYHKNIDNILPPAYFVLAKNKTLYQKIIKYYIQDLTCFNYNHYLNFDWFIDNIIGNKPNIYNIT